MPINSCAFLFDWGAAFGRYRHDCSWRIAAASEGEVEEEGADGFVGEAGFAREEEEELDEEEEEEEVVEEVAAGVEAICVGW